MGRCVGCGVWVCGELTGEAVGRCVGCGVWVCGEVTGEAVGRCVGCGVWVCGELTGVARVHVSTSRAVHPSSTSSIPRCRATSALLVRRMATTGSTHAQRKAPTPPRRQWWVEHGRCQTQDGPTIRQGPTGSLPITPPPHPHPPPPHTLTHSVPHAPCKKQWTGSGFHLYSPPPPGPTHAPFAAFIAARLAATASSGVLVTPTPRDASENAHRHETCATHAPNARARLG